VGVSFSLAIRISKHRDKRNTFWRDTERPSVVKSILLKFSIDFIFNCGEVRGRREEEKRKISHFKYSLRINFIKSALILKISSKTYQ
jgi:hypothetical protein